MAHSKLSPSDLHGHVLRCPSVATTYTPGPWEAGIHPANANFRIIKPVLFGSRVTVLPECEGGHVALKSAADARLIAAAPDLLEALIAARAELEAYEADATGERYNNPILNAAIAKATGAN